MDPSILLVAGLALILLLQFSRVRRQQREARATRSALEVGVEVLTASGMIGTVVATSGTTVTLAGEDGQRTRWVAGAVVRVLPDTDPASSRYRDPASGLDDPAGPAGPAGPASAAGPAAGAAGAGAGAVDLTKRPGDPTDSRGEGAPGQTGSTRQD